MDQPTSDAISQQEARLWSAAAHHLVDDLSVSSEDTLASYERLQAAIRGAERDVKPPGGWKAPYRVLGFGTQTPQWGVFKAQPLRRGIWLVPAVVLGIVLTVGSWKLGTHHIGWRATTSMMTYTTGNGERATIALPDGGTVALNVASRLEVPMDYMTGHRTVRLVGEGLFTVSHHDEPPLTVQAGRTTARVLGTNFVVRHYTTDTATLVAVREGKVAVGTTVVTANQLVEVGQSGVPHVRPSGESPFTFAVGTLTIDGLPLSKAIVELDRWYDADIRLGDPALAKEQMKGTFGAGSLGDLVERLDLMYNVLVVRDGSVLTLFPRH